jgi:sRNA-binding protein
VLRRWCHRPSYLKALVRGGDRVDLTGVPVSKVSADHQGDAAKRLEEKKAQAKVARKAEKGVLKAKEARSVPTPPTIPPVLKAPGRPVLTLRRKEGGR